jgi:hypothetical protein
MLTDDEARMLYVVIYAHGQSLAAGTMTLREYDAAVEAAIGQLRER